MGQLGTSLGIAHRNIVRAVAMEYEVDWEQMRRSKTLADREGGGTD